MRWLPTFFRNCASIVAATVFGCTSKSSTDSSSGDWLSCSSLEDCRVAGAAVDCSSGFCVDSNGGRIPWNAFCRVVTMADGADAATVRALLGDAASGCEMPESNYDQTCRSDADCVEVALGEMCSGVCGFLCGGSAINVADYGRYKEDRVRSFLGPDMGGHESSACGGLICACPAYFGVRCHDGRCEPAPSDVFGDAGP